MILFYKKIALHSYTIVRVVFGVSFLSLIVSYYFIFGNATPLWIFCSFFLATGIFMGYVIAYYSIKFLNREDIKNRLPLN